jgi:hypothetical protein
MDVLHVGPQINIYFFIKRFFTNCKSFSISDNQIPGSESALKCGSTILIIMFAGVWLQPDLGFFTCPDMCNIYSYVCIRCIISGMNCLRMCLWLRRLAF